MSSNLSNNRSFCVLVTVLCKVTSCIGVNDQIVSNVYVRRVTWPVPVVRAHIVSVLLNWLLMMMIGKRWWYWGLDWDWVDVAERDRFLQVVVVALQGIVLGFPHQI